MWKHRVEFRALPLGHNLYLNIVIYLTNPIAAFEKMPLWAKPGGVIVLQEYDFRAWDTHLWSQEGADDQDTL